MNKVESYTTLSGESYKFDPEKEISASEWTFIEEYLEHDSKRYSNFLESSHNELLSLSVLSPERFSKLQLNIDLNKLHEELLEMRGNRFDSEEFFSAATASKLLFPSSTPDLKPNEDVKERLYNCDLFQDGILDNKVLQFKVLFPDQKIIPDEFLYDQDESFASWESLRNEIVEDLKRSPDQKDFKRLIQAKMMYPEHSNEIVLSAEDISYLQNNFQTKKERFNYIADNLKAEKEKGSSYSYSFDGDIDYTPWKKDVGDFIESATLLKLFSAKELNIYRPGFIEVE